MAEGKFIAYYRVSTDHQGRSGLGLEAQREAVHRYLNGGAWTLVAEFTEVESGRRKDRPQLAEAIRMAKREKATLVIARLDRLARNAHFISGLMEARVDFVAADMPNANQLTIRIMAAVAEEGARVISENTKAALSAAKARGVVLGANGRVLATRNKAEALERLEPVADRLRSMRSAGLSVRAIAATLNAEGVASPGGGAWHVANVHRALQRLD